MCGRYSITLPPEAIRQLFQIHRELPNWPAYYNAAPTTALPIVGERCSLEFANDRSRATVVPHIAPIQKLAFDV